MPAMRSGNASRSRAISSADQPTIATGGIW